jgi:hypothetical protein
VTFLLLELQGLLRSAAALSFLPEGVPSMAFVIRNLSVLAYANGFTLWHYKAGRDPLSHVQTVDFFADAADMLSEGDMMMVSAPDGGRILCVATGTDGEIATSPLV